MYEEYSDYADALEVEYERIKALPSTNPAEQEGKIAELNALISQADDLKSRMGEPGLALLDNANALLRKLLPPPTPLGFGDYALFQAWDDATPPTTPTPPTVAVVTP